MLAQEEEVHGKQRELDALKEEEKKLLEEIKASEKEIQKLSHDLEVSSEINTEVCAFVFMFRWKNLSAIFKCSKCDFVIFIVQPYLRKKNWTRNT